MASQLPQGAQAAAAVTLTYGAVSLCCSCIVIWLAWCHNERISYIACIAYFALLSTVASLIQQIHLVAFYRDVTLTQFKEKLANPDSPDHNISNGSVGMDLVLYYIRWSSSRFWDSIKTLPLPEFASYNIQSMFIMFWASELAQSVYGMNKKAKWRRVLRHFNYAGRAIAVVLPLITVLVLQAPPPQNSLQLFILLADVPCLWPNPVYKNTSDTIAVMLSMGCGSALMIAILGRYIHSRRKLLSFDARPVDTTGSSNSWSSATLTRSSTRILSRRSIYDRWLMTRFTIAFVLLAIFQLTGTLFQQFAMGNTANDLVADRPDMSVARAQTTLYLFMPGNTPGIALFIVFGTTAAFRKHMYKTFVPARFQKKAQLPLYDEPTDGDASFVVSSPLALSRSAAKDWSPIQAPASTKTHPDLMKSLPTPPLQPRAPPRWRRASMGPGDDSKTREGSAVFVMTRIVTEVTEAPPRTHGRSESSPAVVLMKPQKCQYPEWI